MNAAARDAYLTTQVMTATPQKLQLLLIDAAIRSAQLGQRHWAELNEEAACEALGHAQEVVAELLASVASAKTDISRRLASIYMYLNDALTVAQVQHDEQQLADVVRVLMIERETWSQVCEKFGSTQTGSDMNMESKPMAGQQSSHSAAAPMPMHSIPATMPMSTTMSAPTRGISFQA